MATTTMASLGYRDILVREGIHPPVTMIVNGATEVYPGYPVTSQGHTYPDVAKADALGDSACGIAGLLENQDIDTVYGDDDEIPVYMTGCGAIVKSYFSKIGGDVVFGEILCADGQENSGHLHTLKKSIADFIADGTGGTGGTILATQIQSFYSLVGRAMETIASSGTVVPIKVLLSI